MSEFMQNYANLTLIQAAIAIPIGAFMLWRWYKKQDDE